MSTILTVVFATVSCILCVVSFVLRKIETSLRRQLAAKDDVITGQRAVMEELLKQRDELLSQKSALAERLALQLPVRTYTEAPWRQQIEVVRTIANGLVELREAQEEKKQDRTDSGAEVDVERFRGL